MQPGPAKILTCPLCGSEKPLWGFLRGDNYRPTVWSDSRSIYPSSPILSPIQQCPKCEMYYFLDETDIKEIYGIYPNNTGQMTYAQLKEAKLLMRTVPLTVEHRTSLNLELLMAFNDSFRRDPKPLRPKPGEDDLSLFNQVVDELLEDMGATSQKPILQAELLRETGRFDQAREILSKLDLGDRKWVADAILRKADEGNTVPFKLLDNGKRADQ